jgi:hypothetical protein
MTLQNTEAIAAEKVPATERAANGADGDLKRPKRKSSAVTSGRRLFVLGDGNSAWSRRYRDLIAGHVADAGVRAQLSEAEFSLVKRAAAIEVELEQAEGRLSMGGTVNLDEYGRAASHLRRILETVGLQRRSRDVTPSLAEYVAARHSEAAG